MLEANPLKIAFLLEGIRISGVNTSIHCLAEELANRGNRIAIFNPWITDSQNNGSLKHVLLPSIKVNHSQSVDWIFPYNRKVINKIRTERFDIIHVFTGTTVNFLAQQAAKFGNIPIIYTYSSMTNEYAHYLGILGKMKGIFQRIAEKYDKFICDQSDAVIAPSRKAAAYLHGIGVSNSSIIPNGIKLEAFTKKEKDFLRRRFNIPGHAKILLFIGRLNYEKRPHIAFEYFRQISGRRNDVCLVMVGEGPQHKHIERKVIEHGLEDRVFVMRCYDYEDMPGILNSGDIWFSTSYSEVHPMTAIEAAACGLPTIAFGDPALDGIVEHNVNGFIIRNEDEFITGINRLLDDKDLYNEMSTMAIQKSRSFPIQKSAEEVVHLYNSVIKAGKGVKSLC